MSCLSPLNIKTKEKGRINVPCGRCLPCLQRKRDDWSFRLAQELKTAKSAVFLTLTYSDDNIPWADTEMALDKDRLKAFLKKLKRNNKWTLKYYSVGEYGTKTGRPHYHAILFNATESTLNSLLDIWDLGSHHIGAANPASIRYLTKYVINKKDDTHLVAPFALISKGLGKNYLQNSDYHQLNHLLTCRNDQGFTQTLPRYYQDKMFDPVHKQWIIDKAIIEKDIQTNKLEKKHGRNYFKQLIEIQTIKEERFLLEFNKKNTI